MIQHREKLVAEAEVDALKALMKNAGYQIERLRSWNSATNQSIRDTAVAA